MSKLKTHYVIKILAFGIQTLQLCTTFMNDFHRLLSFCFAVLLKNRQNSLTNTIPEMLQEPKDNSIEMETCEELGASEYNGSPEIFNAPKLSNTDKLYYDEEMSATSPQSCERMQLTLVSEKPPREQFADMPVLIPNPPESNDLVSLSQQPLLTFDTDSFCIVSNREIVTENRRLWNIGNSCYMNATFQALSTCQLFHCQARELHAMLRSGEVRTRDPVQALLCDDLSYFPKHVSHRGTDTDRREEELRKVPVQELMRCRSLFGKLYREFDNAGQQDAHEYLLLILAFFDDLVKKNLEEPLHSKISLPLPKQLFTSKIETCFQCPKCNNESFKIEEVSDLAVCARQNESVQDLLSNLFAKTFIERTCPKCEWKTAISSQRIVEFPTYLVIHLQRYEYVSLYKASIKRSCLVYPSFQLDVTAMSSYSAVFENKSPPRTNRSCLVSRPFCLINDSYLFPSEPIKELRGGNDEKGIFNGPHSTPYHCFANISDRKRRHSLSEDVGVPSKKMKSQDGSITLRSTSGKAHHDQNVSRARYSLTAAVCHRGITPRSGHYVAYTKEMSKDEWFYCSDSEVNHVKECEMISEVSRDGYVLYYTKEDY